MEIFKYGMHCDMWNLCVASFTIHGMAHTSLLAGKNSSAICFYKSIFVTVTISVGILPQELAVS